MIRELGKEVSGKGQIEVLPENMEKFVKENKEMLDQERSVELLKVKEGEFKQNQIPFELFSELLEVGILKLDEGDSR